LKDNGNLVSLFNSSAFLESFLCDDNSNSQVEIDDLDEHEDNSASSRHPNLNDNSDSEETGRPCSTDYKDIERNNSDNVDTMSRSSSDLDHENNSDLDNHNHTENIIPSDEDEPLIINTNYDSETFTQESLSIHDDLSDSKEPSTMEMSSEDSNHNKEDDNNAPKPAQTINNCQIETKRSFNVRPQRRSLPNLSLSKR